MKVPANGAELEDLFSDTAVEFDEAKDEGVCNQGHHYTYDPMCMTCALRAVNRLLAGERAKYQAQTAWDKCICGHRNVVHCGDAEYATGCDECICIEFRDAYEAWRHAHGSTP